MVIPSMLVADRCIVSRIDGRCFGRVSPSSSVSVLTAVRGVNAHQAHEGSPSYFGRLENCETRAEDSSSGSRASEILFELSDASRHLQYHVQTRFVSCMVTGRFLDLDRGLHDYEYDTEQVQANVGNAFRSGRIFIGCRVGALGFRSLDSSVRTAGIARDGPSLAQEERTC